MFDAFSAGAGAELPARIALRPLQQSVQITPPPAILRRGHPHAPTKQPSEKTVVLIADLQRYRLDRKLLGFQNLLGFLQSQRVNVIQWRHARRPEKPSRKGSLRQTGQP